LSNARQRVDFEFEGDWVKFGADDHPDGPAVTAYLLPDLKETK
jgi:hypothetical protein